MGDCCCVRGVGLGACLGARLAAVDASGLRWLGVVEADVSLELSLAAAAAAMSASMVTEKE
jgi:hypothetical protein